MEATSKERIEELVQGQREFLSRGLTRSIDYRKEQLLALSKAIDKWEDRLYDALMKDLHKSREEAFLTEVGMVKGEIKNHLSHLERWTARKKVRPSVSVFPSACYKVYEPLGNTLIVSPWNYPFQLLVNPLVGCISAGCTAILKPSPYVESVSEVLQQMIEDTFDPGYVAVVQGHRDVNTELFSKRFDLIFLTGSPSLGRIAMEAAARNLTPVVLELGGKSPCIVDKSADVDLAARRIAWGKTLNSGQTCIAPDYLFLHRDIRDRFIDAFEREVRSMHGENVGESPYYVHMVSDRAFDRLVGYLSDGKVVSGGHFDRATRYVEPTLLDGVDPSSSVMQEEIFGPVFPIMEFTDIEDVLGFITSREKPLALYYFGHTKMGWSVVERTSSGGACINDTVMHVASDKVPFGGVGNSGMGRYHGKDSFLAFSHTRTVLVSPTWIDLPVRYPPYRFMGAVRKLMK